MYCVLLDLCGSGSRSGADVEPPGSYANASGIGYPGGSNEKSYWIKDAELDDLIMQARQSTDQTYRKTLYKECLDIVADWAVEIPVYQRQNCIILSSQRVNLDTVTPDITTYWNWYNDLELLEVK